LVVVSEDLAGELVEEVGQAEVGEKRRSKWERQA
jgi:hypothetical protein